MHSILDSSEDSESEEGVQVGTVTAIEDLEGNTLNWWRCMEKVCKFILLIVRHTSLIMFVVTINDI